MAAQTEYKEQLATLEAQGTPLPLSTASSLSAMNIFSIIEVNSAQLFERAVAAMTPEEQSDCGVLYYL